MIGDANDMAWRIRQVLPDRWFADDTPVLNAVLQGLGAPLALLYQQRTYTRQQTRLATATDTFLDMAARDYLGGRMMRRAAEPDAAFSARLRAEIVRPRVTRASIVGVLQALTGHVAHIFEPANATDIGGYGVTGNMGYGVAGQYGDLNLPYQVFVKINRGVAGGIANVAGYYLGSGWAGGGYGVGAIEWTSRSMSVGQVTDADIYAAVASVMPAGGVAWVQIN